MQENQNIQGKSSISPMVIIGILAVIVVAGVAFFVRSNKEEAMESQKQSAQPTVSASTETKVSDTANAIQVEGGNFYFKPNEIKVKKGSTVKITFTNKEGFHDFVVDELNVNSGRIQGGSSKEISFTADKAGTFEFYCSVGDHREMGMKGNLIVE